MSPLAAPQLGQPSTGVGWVWPLPTICGLGATVSNGHSDPHNLATWYDVPGGGKRPHLGVDVMYPRRPHGRPQPPRFSKGFFIPLWCPVIAAASGLVVFARTTAKGGTIEIDHRWGPDGRRTGIGWISYYTHMLPGALLVRDGQWVAAGTPIGWVRGDMSKGPRSLWHLHFELWRDGKRAAAGQPSSWVNPLAWMVRWGRRAMNVDFSTGAAVRCSPIADNEVAVAAPGLEPANGIDAPAAQLAGVISSSDFPPAPRVPVVAWRRGGDVVGEAGTTYGLALRQLAATEALYQHVDRELRAELARRGCSAAGRRVPGAEPTECDFLAFGLSTWSRLGRIWHRFRARPVDRLTYDTAIDYARAMMASRASAVRIGFELAPLPPAVWAPALAATAKEAAA